MEAIDITLFNSIKEAIKQETFTVDDICCGVDTPDFDQYITDVYCESFNLAKSSSSLPFEFETSVRAGQGVVHVYVDDSTVEGSICWDFESEAQIIFNFLVQADSEEQFISLLKDWFEERFSCFEKGKQRRLEI